MTRWTTATLAALALAGCEPRNAGDPGAGFPARPIEIVSWATPGGPTDLLARALADVAADHFDGERVYVSTRQGGAGAAALQYLAGREGDPHVLAVFTASGIVNMASGRIPFGPESVTPLLSVQVDPFLVAVRDDSPFRTLEDLFAEARSRPGEVSMAGFGAASAHFLGFARLLAEAGTPDVRWIAYDGSADAVVAALGGHTDAVHTNYNIIREHVRAGTARVLGVSQPLEQLPDTPSYADQGFTVTPAHWRGVVGPPGLTPAVVAQIRTRLQAAIADPAFAAYMEEAAMQSAAPQSAEALGIWLGEEVTATRGLLEDLELLGER